MATTYRVLGQSALSDVTEATVYTVPSSTQAIVSTIAVVNRSASPATFRIAVRPSADATTATKHYIIYDSEVSGNTSAFFTLGVTMSTGDKVLAYAAGTSVSISVFGSEIA